MGANRGAQITLSWLEGSRAQRIVWLLEELGLSYNLKTYKRINQRAPPELRKIHPLGKSPILEIRYPDVSHRSVLAESAAIMEHLLDNFHDGRGSGRRARLVPKRYADETRFGGETESWRRYRHLMHYAEGSLMPLLVRQIVMNAIKGAPVPFFIKPITGMIANKVSDEYLAESYRTHFGFLEGQLASSPESGGFLCGQDCTAADILMSFPVQVAFTLAVAREDYPRLAAYVGRLQAEEGYKRSIKRVEEAEGTPYRLI